MKLKNLHYVKNVQRYRTTQNKFTHIATKLNYTPISFHSTIEKKNNNNNNNKQNRQKGRGKKKKALEHTIKDAPGTRKISCGWILGAAQTSTFIG